jgi:hypothetical protein
MINMIHQNKLKYLGFSLLEFMLAIGLVSLLSLVFLQQVQLWVDKFQTQTIRIHQWQDALRLDGIFSALLINAGFHLAQGQEAGLQFASHEVVYLPRQNTGQKTSDRYILGIHQSGEPIFISKQDAQCVHLAAQHDLRIGDFVVLETLLEHFLVKIKSVHNEAGGMSLCFEKNILPKHLITLSRFTEQLLSMKTEGAYLNTLYLHNERTAALRLFSGLRDLQLLLHPATRAPDSIAYLELKACIDSATSTGSAMAYWHRNVLATISCLPVTFYYPLWNMR